MHVDHRENHTCDVCSLGMKHAGGVRIGHEATAEASNRIGVLLLRSRWKLHLLADMGKHALWNLPLAAVADG